MVVHSISNILNSFSQKNEYSLPFLESFIKEYSQKVTEDKKVPLFSHTSKYNNFPVRRQWKNTDDRRTKPKPDWRQQKLEITIIKKENSIRENATRILNKLTENNFEKQSSELLTFLIKNKQKDSVSVIAKLILEKICYDKAFYSLYVKLCHDLWSNDEWISDCFQVHCVDKKDYFYNVFFEPKSNISATKGPYKTEEKAIKNALKMVNFKSVFLGLCRDIFYNRSTFINEAKNEEISSNKSYLLKRKLFGSIEIIGYFYVKNYIAENIIHYILSTLCVETKYEEEIETLKLLWDIIYEKINNKSRIYYRSILKKKLNEDWKPRIMFMIEDMIFEDNIGDEKNNIIENSIIDNFIKLSRNGKSISEITDTANTNLLNNLVSSIIKDSMEYENYMLTHINTILLLLKNTISFINLSNSFTLAGNDISDIKIDAPNAPKNMYTVISKIINETKEGNIRVHISDNMAEEWNNIYKMADTSVIKTRFILE